MFFLLRMAFWLGLVLILLPGSSSERAPANTVAASDAISAASATVGDLRQFCARQPDACTIGSQVATELGYRAQAGAKTLYEFLSEALGPKQASSIVNGGKSNPFLENASQNTLAPTDLVPAWRGPVAPPRKPAKHSA